MLGKLRAACCWPGGLVGGAQVAHGAGQLLGGADVVEGHQAGHQAGHQFGIGQGEGSAVGIGHGVVEVLVQREQHGGQAQLVGGLLLGREGAGRRGTALPRCRGW